MKLLLIEPRVLVVLKLLFGHQGLVKRWRQHSWLSTFAIVILVSVVVTSIASPSFLALILGIRSPASASTSRPGSVFLHVVGKRVWLRVALTDVFSGRTQGLLLS